MASMPPRMSSSTKFSPDSPPLGSPAALPHDPKVSVLTAEIKAMCGGCLPMSVVDGAVVAPPKATGIVSSSTFPGLVCEADPAPVRRRLSDHRTG